MQKIPFFFAVNTVLILLTGILVFHLLVLFQVIPYGIVWGGRLKSVEQMWTFEATSIAINALLFVAVSIKAGYLKTFVPIKVVNMVLWCFVVLFALNSVGNLFAKASLETVIFTPVTLVLALLSYRLVTNKTVV